ncbi:hypothetical protein ACSHT3_11945 [Clostridium botulinum]
MRCKGENDIRNMGNEKSFEIDNSKNDKDVNKAGSYLALCLCFGCSLGVIFKNIPLFVGSGIVIGTILEAGSNKRK